MRHAWLLAAALVLTGCASAPIKKQDVPKLAQADARVLDGCYDCLIEARDTYNRVGVGKARPLIIARLFETQLLIALREKELSLDSALAFARARELAREMPVAAEAQRYLALAEAVPPEAHGTPRSELVAYHLQQRAFGATINDELQWLRLATVLREPVRQYLSLAVDCGYMGRAGRPGRLGTSGDEWTASLSKTDLVDAPPLVAYRAAICQTLEVKALDRVHTAIPEFAEAGLYLGRAGIAQARETGGAQARELLAEARGRFVDSIAINFFSGHLSQFAGDCRTAIDFYDKVIARKPVHEDALLGRTACLSFLKRHEEAIAQATRIIEISTDNYGDGYYWRAWNYHALTRLEPARADVERAKSLIAREDTFTLAGIIEHDQDDLPVADADLNRAKTMDRARMNCTARWYLALVKMKQERWGDSSTHFEDAMNCYARNVADSEARLQAIEARADLDPAFKAQQILGFQTAIKEDRSQQYAAAFNTANQAARGANLARASAFLEIAARDPDLAKPVGELRDILKGG